MDSAGCLRSVSLGNLDDRVAGDWIEGLNPAHPPSPFTAPLKIVSRNNQTLFPDAGVSRPPNQSSKVKTAVNGNIAHHEPMLSTRVRNLRRRSWSSTTHEITSTQ